MKTGGVIFRFILGLLLCLRTLRGIGLVAFCPITVPVLLYALFSSRSR